MTKYTTGFLLFIGLASTTHIASACGNDLKVDEQRGRTHEAARSWAVENYSAALNEVLPLRRVGNFPAGADWIAVVRYMAPPHPELRIELWDETGRNGARTLASVTTLAGSPLLDQMSAYRAELNQPLGQLLRRIALERWQLTSDECPALNELGARLRSIAAPVVPDRALVLDPALVEVRVETIGSNEVFVRHETSNPAPIVTWADELRRAVEDRCKRTKLKPRD